ncbi:MAG: rod shape-determining protein MreC [Cytophagaceae bacterium]|jgi:rod shape-determining protein MreC|nr:rod shape-determining protein MreC [Cytophagaceae bacterium]
MQEIIRFIERHHFIILFLIFEALSFYLIVNYNQTQRTIFLDSSGKVAASLLNVSGSVRSYFSLRKTNDELSRENAYLRTLIPEAPINPLGMSAATEPLSPDAHRYHPARVINNSINRPNNTLTLNRGREHGIGDEAGVISARGLVGIVSKVSENYSLVISVLNTKFRVSAKLRSSGYFGSLTWDGKSYQHAVLSEIPAHAAIQVGDAVVTSGYSAVFPENILIGIIESFELEEGEGFYDICVKLSVDFKNLTYVEIVEKVSADEQHTLENELIQ